VLRVLPAQDWLVAFSPAKSGGCDVNAGLDFAVIRLRDRFGFAAVNRRHGFGAAGLL
jgi:hypothetical protein